MAREIEVQPRTSKFPMMIYNRGQQAFSVKDQTVNTFSFIDRTTSLVPAQLCWCGMNAAIEDPQ